MKKFFTVLFLFLGIGLGSVTAADAGHHYNGRRGGYTGGDYIDGIYCPNNLFRAECRGFVPMHQRYYNDRRYDNYYYRPYRPYHHRRHYRRDYHYGGGGVELCFFCRDRY